ncbi:hypothetical protein Pst134EA_001186 [Puccinia striiformis f. sp. tritici]|uniref:hypothetical protein n=1 Tax=Puccinia striiformis f. sp. tritici TaxID=168172 RepID=UPI002007B3BF|nr:hypothetical protein Pst134EA_001186 [Puccinia striiformis f. sp. tritici]KAH9467389.1 hypothetical protein Pst134EB_002403 [Puccinia striiformis f. sp. tritici]KAH9474145.1 hypothetical protein Pst134EA_001186 [Puccinia striiformis f. sp. tritici]KAI9628077.1 hypothetical protein H4Q26_018225 [Puccinia striiformis f. sp. tritici PST-130]
MVKLDLSLRQTQNFQLKRRSRLVDSLILSTSPGITRIYRSEFISSLRQLHRYELTSRGFSWTYEPDKMKIQFFYVSLTVVAFLALVDESQAAPAPFSFKGGWDWIQDGAADAADHLGWHWK